jgi:hypothetical protein
MDRDAIQRFIQRWGKSAGAERANYQLFLAELCDALAVPRPDPRSHRFKLAELTNIKFSRVADCAITA